MRKDAESSGEIGGGEAAGTVAGLFLRFWTALLTGQAETYCLFPLDQNPRETMSSEDGCLRSMPF